MRKTRHRCHFPGLPHRFVKDSRNREENVVPMINVIFLLLLYFMVAGNLDPDFNILLPVATQNSETRSQIPSVHVARNGKMWFESRNIEPHELKAELAGKSGYGKLKIHADANVDALIISTIMNVAAEAGIFRFVLVTQSRTDAP